MFKAAYGGQMNCYMLMSYCLLCVLQLYYNKYNATKIIFETWKTDIFEIVCTDIFQKGPYNKDLFLGRN